VGLDTFDGAKPRFLDRAKNRRSVSTLSIPRASDRGVEWFESTSNFFHLTPDFDENFRILGSSGFRQLRSNSASILLNKSSNICPFQQNTGGEGKHSQRTVNPTCHQSDEGRGLGSWTSISFSQQTGLPSPALVQRISVPHTEQRYLLPSWLII
jgi:hypothetical protein